MNGQAGRSPWAFVPTLYFQQGVPVILVQVFATLLYKRLGVPNDEIALWTSLIQWPWVLKMFWGPWVDLVSTRLRWIRAMQLLLTVGMGAVALSLSSDSFLVLSLCVLTLCALASATHDIALDGYYMLALRTEQQAAFSGIRNTGFRLGWLFVTGGLVFLAGWWEERGLPVARSWQYAILVGAAVYGLFALYAWWAAPVVATDRPGGADDRAGGSRSSFGDVFRTFFALPQIGLVLAFILLYRVGEVMLTKMAGPFLLDARADGGLGLTTVQVGSVMGVVGTIALLAGGLLGGYLIARFGLRRMMWPMVWVMTIPNFPYVWAAYAQPDVSWVYLLTGAEYFGYGFGLASYMVYLMLLCQRSRYPTAHYAICTALMALGGMGAGIASGYLQTAYGYLAFFIIACLATIPGIVLVGLLMPAEDPPPIREAVAA